MNLAKLRELLAEHHALVVRSARLYEQMLSEVAKLEGDKADPGVPPWVAAKERAEREDFRASPTDPGHRSSSPPAGTLRCPTCGAPMARKAGRSYCLACSFDAP